MPKIAAMLCEEVETNGFQGFDADKITQEYRKAVVSQLKAFMVRGFVAERKAISK
jgi:hypothetical protein